MEPETKEVLALSREWLAIAESGRAPPSGVINSFIALWVAFNALYAARFDRIHGDREQVREFGKWPVANDTHQRASTKNPEYRLAVAVLAQSGVYNYLKSRTEHISDLRDLSQVMEAVYQVRCNLFHGRKSPANMRDHSLVTVARTIVLLHVRELLNDEEVWQSAA